MKSPPGIWETHYQRSYIPFAPLEPSTNLREVAAGLASGSSVENRAKSEERRLRRPAPRMSIEPRSRSEGPAARPPIYNRTKGKRTLGTMNAFYDDPTAAGRVTRGKQDGTAADAFDANANGNAPNARSEYLESFKAPCPNSGGEAQPAGEANACHKEVLKDSTHQVNTADNLMSVSNTSSNTSTDTTLTIASQTASEPIEKLMPTEPASRSKADSIEASPEDASKAKGDEGGENQSAEPASGEKCKVKLRKKTEYKSKFRPFSAYVYLQGEGFKKRKHLCSDECDRAKEWYYEVTDRSYRAFELQKASQCGHPVLGDGRLDEIYSKDILAGPWAHARDRSLDALSLATVQLKIQEKRREREEEQIRKQQGSSQSHQGATRRGVSPAASSLKSHSNKAAVTSIPHQATKAAKVKATPPQPARRSSKSKSPGPPGTVSPLGKVWIRAQAPHKDKKEEAGPKESKVKSPTDGNQASPRPASLTGSTRSSLQGSLIAEAAAKAAAQSAKNGQVPSGPVKVTDIKTPEEATGIKSPEPESWTVEIESDNALIWMNGKESHYPESGHVESTPVPVTAAAVSAVNTGHLRKNVKGHPKNGREGDKKHHHQEQQQKPASTGKAVKERRELFEDNRADSAENSAASTTASTDSSFLNQSSSCDASTPKGHSKARQKASVVIEKTRKRLNNLWTKKS